MIFEARPGADAAVARTAATFLALIDDGWTIPLPGAGATAQRWTALAELGAADLPLARLAEGHADALAILTEMDGPQPGSGRRLGVWAADPPSARVTADRTPNGWRLHGCKAWCSGSRVLTDALVTAHADDGPRLFLIDLLAGVGERIRVDPSVWVGPGMVASDTADVYLDGVPAVPIGRPGGYVERPGFWHGGIGVAAVWVGGARGVAGALRSAAGQRPGDPHLAVALGAVDTVLYGAEGALRDAARAVDSCPADLPSARLRAYRLRALAARCADEVLATVGRSLGAAPLARDGGHAQRVADLAVYVRQHHGERDLAALGELLRTAVEGES